LPAPIRIRPTVFRVCWTPGGRSDFVPAVEPGSSFGLHDSLGNLRQTTRIADGSMPAREDRRGVAHGYARHPGGDWFILHNVRRVSYTARWPSTTHTSTVCPFVDLSGVRVPPPTDRRRNIDWIQERTVPGQRRAGLPKWDFEPRSAGVGTGHHTRGAIESARANRRAGYIALDAGLQEQPLDDPIRCQTGIGFKVPAQIGPVPSALRQTGEAFCQSKRPVIIPGHVGPGSRRVSIYWFIWRRRSRRRLDTNISTTSPTAIRYA